MNLRNAFQHLVPAFGEVTIKSCYEDFNSLQHGFSGKGIFDRTYSIEDARKQLKSLFPGKEIVLPLQTHSDLIVDVDATPACYEGDAIVLSRGQHTGTVFGIRTADCVPLILSSARSIALIHAGWRGLANGIIGKTLKRFPQDSPLTVLIGPCAGPKRYLVGNDVIAAIGESVVYERELESGKFLLNMAKTAASQINASHTQVTIFNCAMCTISDEQFHSYRRDGDKSGRNLSFVSL